MDAIVASGISKVFRLNKDPAHSIKERLLRFGRTQHEDFTALQQLDLTVTEGTTLGILGHNGSGKSTLLKCLSGILKPTTGTIQLRGRLASLLELGAGFHPELTGRENVYINAAFLGIGRREIDRIFDDIVAFADLDRFIDEPVKHYSSGMYVRLGFAVAVNVNPDILLIDEVLAVGDEVFQRRCLDRIRLFQQEGRTILFVTHAADLVRQVCDRAIVLHHGELVADGRPGDSIRIFREHLQGELTASKFLGESEQSGALRLTSVSLQHPHLADRNYLLPGEPLTVRFGYEADLHIEYPMLTISITTLDGQSVWALDIPLYENGVGALSSKGEIALDLSTVPLLDGTFRVDLVLTDRQDPAHSASRQGMDEFTVMNPTGARGVVAVVTSHLHHHRG